MEEQHAHEPVTSETEQAEAEEAKAAHRADREPTPEEAAAAERSAAELPDVSEAFQEAAERGANVKGEGQIG